MAPLRTILAAAIAIITPHYQATAIDLDVDNASSIRHAASTIAYDLQAWYKNNQTDTEPTAVGTMPPPQYWWFAGAVWGAMMEYHAYTHDASYNDVITQALLAQVEPDWNFMPPAYFSQLGN